MVLDDNYGFSAYSVLFNAVNNSIFIRDKVANQVKRLWADKNGTNLSIHNEERLKKIIFNEIMGKYNARIRDHELNFQQLASPDISKLNIVKFILIDQDQKNSNSGYYEVFPRTFRCTKCGDYKVLNFEQWENFNPDKCQQKGCDGYYVQVSILGFCETCGNVDTVRNPCPEHGYEYLQLIQPDKESPASWKLKCRKCGKILNFRSYPCNHINKRVYGDTPVSNNDSTPYELINVRRGGLFQSCVKTTVDVPENNDSEFIDEIIMGIYLNSFEDFNLRVGKEIRMIHRFLDGLKKYPTKEDREDAIDFMGISEDFFSKGEQLKDKLMQIRVDVEEYSLSEVNDYLILKQLLNFSNDNPSTTNISLNSSFNSYYDVSEEEYESFKEDFGIDDITYIPDMQLISTSYGSIKGINKFYDPDFTPHFEPHWKNTKEREEFDVYSYPFETEGIMFDLDKLKLVNWLLDTYHPSWNHFVSEDEAKAYLFNLKENDEEFKALFKLIHTFSHILIKRSSLYTGLNADSCSELLFPKSGAFMIYSTSNINIGGFAFVFEHSLFDWFNEIKLDIQDCLFDPSCINEEGACFSCMHLPEYVCCNFNKLLDRDVFMGNYRFNTGFWKF